MNIRRFFRVLGYSILSVLLFVAFGLYRLNVLNQTPLNVSNFSTLNKIEIYGLGLVMSVAAYPLYPEVAREHLMLYLPFSGKPKPIEDNFFLRSEVVRDAIIQAKSTGKEVPLLWPIRAYTFSTETQKYWEARIALAFNGGWLSVRGNKVTARIPIAYPAAAFAPLFNLPGVGTVGVQEGLFKILQEAGWYHTGEAIWTANLPPENIELRTRFRA